MNDQLGGLWRLRRRVATADVKEPETRRPIIVVVLIGFALALISIASFFLPSQVLRNAASNARPLLIGIFTAPLLLGMLAAIVRDAVGGKTSLLVVIRQLGALLIVAGCIILGLLIAQRPDLLTVGGCSLLIGFAVGTGLTFASGGSPIYTDGGLAIFGWSAFAIPTLVGLIVYAVTYKPDATPGRCLACGGLAQAIAMSICFGAFAVACIAGITTVPLGGVVGGWLRRGSPARSGNGETNRRAAGS